MNRDESQLPRGWVLDDILGTAAWGDGRPRRTGTLTMRYRRDEMAAGLAVG